MKILEILKRMFITRKCIICHTLISYDQTEPFCEECSELWENQLDIKCHRCSYDREYCICLPKHISDICNSIAAWAVFYDSKSQNTVNNLVYIIKRTGYRDAIDFCTDRMKLSLLAVCKMHNINLDGFEITYPSRKKSGIRKYGFDHTKLLAKYLGKKLNMNTVKLFKNIGHNDQKELTKSQRLKNAAQSYILTDSSYVKGKKFLLVDDVMTTGATLCTCAELLYNNGAECVIPVTYAKDNF